MWPMRGVVTLVPVMVFCAWLGSGSAAQPDDPSARRDAGADSRPCPRRCGHICCDKDEVCAHGPGLRSKCLGAPSGQPASRKTARPSPQPPSPSTARPSAELDLAKRSPAELIELYVFHPDCGFRTFADPAAYHAALAENRAITAELLRRGERAAGTCRLHLRDLRNIFDGDGGAAKNVAGVCQDLLRTLDTPSQGRSSTDSVDAADAGARPPLSPRKRRGVTDHRRRSGLEGLPRLWSTASPSRGCGHSSRRRQPAQG